MNRRQLFKASFGTALLAITPSVGAQSGVIRQGVTWVDGEVFEVAVLYRRTITGETFDVGAFHNDALVDFRGRVSNAYNIEILEGLEQSKEQQAGKTIDLNWRPTYYWIRIEGLSASPPPRGCVRGVNGLLVPHWI